MWCKKCGHVGQVYTTEESARKYWKDDRKLNIQPNSAHTIGQIQKDPNPSYDILNELANINKTGQEIAALLKDLFKRIDTER